MSTSGEIRELARHQAIEIVRHFCGEPNHKLSNGREVRWFPHGGFVLYLDSGKWHSFSDGARGDMADLVVRELGVDQKGALRWLADWVGVQKPVATTITVNRGNGENQFEAERLAAAKFRGRPTHLERGRAAACDTGRSLPGSSSRRAPIPAPIVRSAQLRFHRSRSVKRFGSECLKPRSARWSLA